VAPSAWYNVLVIGSELSGLVYAALAARGGYRVAVVQQDGKPNAYRREGRVLLRYPEIVYGLNSSPFIAKVFTELAMLREMQMRPVRLEPPLQIAGPDIRLDLVAASERWERGVARELGEAGLGLAAFERWAEHVSKQLEEALASGALLPPRGLGAGGRYRSLFGPQLVELASAREGGSNPGPALAGPADWMVRAALAHLSGLGDAPVPRARLWTQLRNGLCRLPDGLDGLGRVFLERLREHYGDWRAEDRVAALSFKGSKAIHARLDRGEVIGCDLVVMNLDPLAAAALLPRDRRLSGLLSAERPSAWRVAYDLVVDPRVLPAAMGPEVLWVGDPRAPLAGANNLWISRPSMGLRGARDGRPGPGTLAVSAVVPGTTPPGREAIEALERGIQVELGRLLPWFDRNLLARDIPALRHLPQTDAPHLDGTLLRPLYDRSIPRTLGLSPCPQETGHPRVMLAGAAPFSGLGFEGTFYAALQLLERTRRLLKLRVQVL
jgi:phytoene dehydrogenase-like protein